MADQLDLYFLGSPHLELDGIPITFDRNKALVLLAYLAIERGPHTREALATLLWPDYDHEHAYAYLRRTLWTINDGLGENWLAVSREQVELPPNPGLEVDVWRFQAALDECSQHGHPTTEICPRCIHPLEQAVSIYRGDFLAGFSLRDTAVFDEWQTYQSEKFRADLASALQRLSMAFSEQGEDQQAITAARRWLALDLLNEAAHRQLMLAYAQSGQRNAALRQYRDCKRILMDELGVEPQDETTQLYESIRAGSGPASEFTTSTPKSESLMSRVGAVQQINLPRPSTAFVGRENELDQIEELLSNPECRLLTLQGPGGIGKTRLSIEAARQAAGGDEGANRQNADFKDGIVFVPLAPVNSTESIVPAIASSMSLQFRSEQMRRDTPESQKVQLIEYLRHRQTLLVLDNFEHLVAGAILLPEMLDSSQGLKIMVTSRERLHLAEEWVYQVSGMSFPKNGGLESLETFSAVQLFLQNARRGRADFTPTEEDRASIARICKLVEGVPLAIELAAAWIKMLSCSEIAREIESSLDFLTSTQQDVSERHQSLRAVFEHSWNLLDDSQREIFMRLSIFRSPYRREAAAFVVDQGSGGSARFLLHLSALVDKSLLRRVETSGQETRFEMHELVKQYAAEKLHNFSGETRQTGQRHAAFYASWLARQLLQMRGHRQVQALNEVDREIEDVRAAWRWSIEQDNLSAIREMMHGLFQFYNSRSRLEEAEEDFRLAVEALARWQEERVNEDASSDDLSTLKAWLLGYYSSALFNMGNYDLAVQYYTPAVEMVSQTPEPDRASLSILLGFGSGVLPPQEVKKLYQETRDYFERTGDRWEVAMAMLVHVNFIQYTIIDVETARQLCQNSLDIFRELGDQAGMIQALNSQAFLFYSLGEYEATRQVSQESLELCRQVGDRWRVATAMLNLGQANVALGDYEQAKVVYRESLALVRELGNRRVVARYLACLGYVYYLQTDYQPAEALFQEALDLSRQIGDTREMGMANMNLGNIAMSSGNLTEARRRYQWAIDLLEELSYARWEYSICLKRMASLCLQSEDYSAAAEFYRQAMEISVQIKRTPEILENLVGIAELHLLQGKPEQAAEILSFVEAQEEIAEDMRRHAAELIAQAAQKLSKAALEQALAQGKKRSLNELVRS